MIDFLYHFDMYSKSTSISSLSNSVRKEVHLIVLQLDISYVADYRQDADGVCASSLSSG